VKETNPTQRKGSESLYGSIELRVRCFLQNQNCFSLACSRKLARIMKIKPVRSLFVFAVLLAMGTAAGLAGDLTTIHLPTPDQSGGKPLMAALKTRQSTREFSSQALPGQMLSDLLWAGFGINRPENEHRTAPSTMNMQEIDIYVATADGLYRYAALPHELRPVVSGDLRAQTTGQAALQAAPVALIFVADYGRMTKAKPAERDFYAAIDTGFIVQNIYLYCASAGLAAVVHELDRAKLVATMKLAPDQKIIIAQAVGFPK